MAVVISKLLLFQEGTLNSKPNRMVMTESEQQFAGLRKAFDELANKVTNSEFSKQFKVNFLAVGFSVVKMDMRSTVKCAQDFNQRLNEEGPKSTTVPELTMSF